MNYFFCGIGGSGMSALAIVLKSQGRRVSGSDRSYDSGLVSDTLRQLAESGITLFPQDGSGVAGADVLVVSSAVEAHIPDVRAAQEKGIPILKRAELLARIVGEKKGIAVAGTSGKSTTTGMIAHIMALHGLDPLAINGAVMLGPGSNAMTGKGEWAVYETDESDGTIALFQPDIAVLTNIAKDHKSIEELRGLFGDFVGKAKLGAVINMDCPESAKLAGPDAATFSLNGEAATLCGAKMEFTLPVPGAHNRANALAAMAAAQFLGIPPAQSAAYLQSFKGIKSRLQVLGAADGVTVIDDFGHNPDKIAATLATLAETPGRVLVFFQAHGYGPTRMHWDALIDVFSRGLRQGDLLAMPEIFYAGGSATKDISARGLVEAVEKAGHRAVFTDTKARGAEILLAEAKPGDRIVVMGARDDGLRQMAASLLESLRKRAAA